MGSRSVIPRLSCPWVSRAGPAPPASPPLRAPPPGPDGPSARVVARGYTPGRQEGGGLVQTLLSVGELADLNAHFETAHPAEIVRWTLEESGLPRGARAPRL